MISEFGIDTSRNVIEVRNLVMVYRLKKRETVRALAGVSFDVGRGEIFGLLGPNGAGKSTLVKILTTLITPTEGRASILGFDVVGQPLAVRRNIVAVLQENAVELFLSVEDNFRTFGRFQGLTGRETERRMDAVLGMFDLHAVRKHKAIDLSGGMKRRVQVAKVFMVDKPVIFLDEATTGMDAINRRIVLTALRQEAARGRTIVLTTHVLAEAEELCDRLVIINRGSIIASGTPLEVTGLAPRLSCLTVTCGAIGPEVREFIGTFPAENVRSDGTVIEFTVPDEFHALEILTSLRKIASIRHFEIRGASLEDAFLEILDPEKRHR